MGIQVSSEAVPKLPHLRAWRDRAIMTQRDLAAASGVNWMTIHRIEHGQDARPSTVRKLAAALGAQPTDLLRPPPE